MSAPGGKADLQDELIVFANIGDTDVNWLTGWLLTENKLVGDAGLEPATSAM